MKKGGLVALMPQVRPWVLAGPPERRNQLQAIRRILYIDGGVVDSQQRKKRKKIPQT
jgi:hypothetical protein